MSSLEAASNNDDSHFWEVSPESAASSEAVSRMPSRTSCSVLRNASPSSASVRSKDGFMVVQMSEQDVSEAR